MKDLSLDSDPEETGTTFFENAKLKADSARKAALAAGLTDYAVVADDSGLCVDALDGAPGIYSSRYAEVDGAPCTYDDNNNKLLADLDEVPEDDRTAKYVTSAVFITPDGKYIDTFETCEGRIDTKKTGSNGFGFDPLFLPADFNFEKSMASYPADVKDKISHRAKALNALKDLLV